jgi:subtilisin family serine protease
VIEADPQGAAIVRSEVLALPSSPAALEKARAAGFVVARERSLEGLETSLLVLRAPPGMSTRKALKKLRALDSSGTYDFNHVYTESGVVEPTPARAVETNPTAATTPGAADANVPVPARIGLIDGGVDVAHPVFRDASITTHGCGGQPVANAHGTAVASLMVGRSEKFRGAAPVAALYAADVYCGVPTGGAVDAVADALAWLARERVPIINVSLVGPANRMLENVVRIVVARGHLVIAAVGNDGPAAPPLYPAAYAGVVGVTAVDAKQRALLEAARGEQVDFAAPGADIAAAGSDQAYAAVRGTSFAAPIVAGLLVAEMPEPDAGRAKVALATLARLAIDLGSPGLDTTYGHGLVGDRLRIELAAPTVLAK